MNVTVSDLIHSCNLDKLRLVAGKGGLNRTVTKGGILDYEYDNSVINKFYYANFEEGQFVLTSFLYAKDNEYLIFEALKHLINKKVSGLAIKNIFNIPLHHTFLRYADSKNFPVFLIEDTKLYFEDIIVTISECVENLASIDYGSSEVDMILNGSLDDFALTQHAFQINHSLRPDLLTIYFSPKRTLPTEFYIELLNRYKKSDVYSLSNSLFRYRNGLLFIYSCEVFQTNDIREIVSEYIGLIAENHDVFYIGVSDLHHRPAELKNAFNESIYAAIMHRSSNDAYQLYKDLGVYRVILPFIEYPQLQTFSNQIIEPLLDYDAENKTKLTETALQFISCGGSYQKLAQTLSQHENTIRYRLDKIRKITGLDTRIPEQYEQLSIAVKIYLGRNLIKKFHQELY